jgi:hypothetical protein
MKQPARPLNERDLRREFPIEGKVPGWFFCQREVSAGCYVVAGRDLYGREVSSSTFDPEIALQECVDYARRLSQPNANEG